ncbi:hypothetical protein CBS101457_003566 [Exobasidium rhododendri]|nr:hypothetical protein CBS101457_003566 [Exobasidium rhododendri]
MALSRVLSTLLVASLAFTSTLAQGDPEALTPNNKNKPTKAWTQWQPKPTYALADLPDQYMGANRIPGGGEPQSGWNQCVQNKWNQKSQCQTAWINSINDWCIWGPPDGGEIGSTERVAVAYCTTNKHGTRLIPDGTITGAHFLKTPSYVQISGVGDFTSLGIPEGDAGGEMDSAGADDLGNPIGGVIFTTANPDSNGQPAQAQHWTNFMSYNQFCLRACWGDQASAHCQHVYDILGCRWNMPSTTGYDAGFETCEGDDAPLQGIYGGSTFSQGQAVTPDAHPPAASSNCVVESSIRHGLYGEWQTITSSSATMTTTATTPGSPSPTSGTATNPGATIAGNVDSTNQNSSQSSGALHSLPSAGTSLFIVALAALAGVFFA